MRASRSHLTDPLFLLWGNVISIRILGSFNLTFTLLADLRMSLLSLRTGLLILLANGTIETLFQLVPSCFETV